MNNFNHDDTICALATGGGISAIALIRVSGNESIKIVDKIFSKNLKEQKSHTVHFGNIFHDDNIIDEVVITIFHKNQSFTGEETVEISCHGSKYIQNKILELLINSGVRLANPGEYTMRAFKNGKLDLSQAESIADLIESESEAAHKSAIQHLRGGFSKKLQQLRKKLIDFASLIELELDFSEEDVEFADRSQLNNLLNVLQKEISSLINSFKIGNVIKNGIPVTIIGAPNVGKSTLLNTLLNEDKAIVSDIAGTTRDSIEDEIIISAGAIGSPKLLMLSGIGPEKELNKHDIKIVQNLSGVGENLQDHYDVDIVYELKGQTSLDKYKKPHWMLWAGLEYMLFNKGPVTSNAVEAGAFNYSTNEKSHPDLQFHFLPAAL